MDGAILIALLLTAVGLGALLGISTYAKELQRMARFLRERERRSGARLTTEAIGPGLVDLANAVNAELDRSLEERICALRHQQDFQRDLSALSHDIRTPLTGAKGYLQLAVTESCDRTRAGCLDAAAARIDSTTALLDQLFAYTRASDPDLALEREPVEVRPLIEAVLIGHYPEFEQLGWEPALRMDDSGLSIVGDRDALSRIIENLVANAIRYGASAPIIEVRADVIIFSNRVTNPAAIDIAHLFDRFYQADASRRAQGSGLGLSTASKLADAMSMELAASLEADMLAIRLEAASDIDS